MFDIEQTLEKTLQGLVHLITNSCRTFFSYLFAEPDLSRFLPDNETDKTTAIDSEQYVGPLSYLMVSILFLLITRYAFSPYPYLDSVDTQIDESQFFLEKWIAPIIENRDTGKLLSTVFPVILLVLVYSGVCKLFAKMVKANAKFSAYLSTSSYCVGTIAIIYAFAQMVSVFLLPLYMRAETMVIAAGASLFIFGGLTLRAVYRYVIGLKIGFVNSWIKVSVIIIGAFTTTSAILWGLISYGDGIWW